MVDMRLLEQRNALKARKPDFLRQDANRNKSLAKKWRKAKGMHSKMRLHLRGRRKSPSPGYASPAAVKGLSRQGLRERIVKNLKGLQSFDPAREIVVFGHIGLKKKLRLMKLCAEKKYSVAHIKDIQIFLQEAEKDLSARKLKRKEREENKKKTKEDSPKKTKESKTEEKKEESPATPLEQEETKKGEKSEKIKVLEKKQ